MEFHHDCLHQMQLNVRAIFHFQATSQRFQLAALIDLELQAVHGFLRMRYDVGLLNFSSRPRDVLPEECAQNFAKHLFQMLQTRTTRRLAPLYALTLEVLCEGEGYRAQVELVQPNAYTPKWGKLSALCQ